MLPPKTLTALALAATLMTACAPFPARSDQAGPATSLPPAVLPTLAATTLPTSQSIEPAPTVDAGRTAGCPALEDILAQIAASTDPVQQAKQMAIPLKDGDKIQVLVTLNQADPAFLASYGAEIGSRSGNDVQAYMLVTRLCELARDGRVSAIKLPLGAITP